MLSQPMVGADPRVCPNNKEQPVRPFTPNFTGRHGGLPLRLGVLPSTVALECGEEAAEGLIGIAGFVEQGNELRADDGTGGMALGGL